MKAIGEIIIYLILFLFLFWVYSKLYDLVLDTYWAITDKIRDILERRPMKSRMDT